MCLFRGIEVEYCPFITTVTVLCRFDVMNNHLFEFLHSLVPRRNNKICICSLIINAVVILYCLCIYLLNLSYASLFTSILYFLDQDRFGQLLTI